MLFGAPGERLYAITPDLAATSVLLEKCSAMLSAGVAALQYRNKSAPPELRRTQANHLLQLCAEFGTPLVINDDWQLATEIGAAGAHIGRNDGDLNAIRQQFSGLLGVSCYNNLEAAERAEQAGADYVAFGSFFASRVKPDAQSAELALLERAAGTLSIPIVAIGGITLSNAASLRVAGADAVAVISALFDAADIGATIAAFNRLL